MMSSVVDFLAGLGVDLQVADAVAGLLLNLIETIFSVSDVAGNNAIVHVTAR